MVLKVCCRCNKELSSDLFGIEKRASDGLTSACKKCLNDARRPKRDSYQTKIDRVKKTLDNLPATRICTNCKEEKPLESFNKNPQGKYGRLAKCRPCMQKYRSNHYFSNPEYRKRRIARATEINRKRKYGVTPEEFKSILASQNYLCAICSIHLDGSTFSLKGQLDHSHEDGTVRGILCGKCNTGLGLFKDDPDILLEAVSYLNRVQNG